jgi:hypothetical protein
MTPCGPDTDARDHGSAKKYYHSYVGSMPDTGSRGRAQRQTEIHRPVERSAQAARSHKHPTTLGEW